MIHNESTSNPKSISVSYYGSPSIISSMKHHTLTNQNSSSSENSTPNRIKKLFYEVVV